MFFDTCLTGFFIGSAAASLFVGIVGWTLVRDYLRLGTLHWRLWPELLRFGIPLLPAGIAMYFMTTSDRWFVQFYHGEEALGIFAIGAKFAMLFTIAVETFRKAWWPIAMDAMHSDDGPYTFRLIARLYLGVSCSGVLLLTMLSKSLVRVFTQEDFHSAWPIIGVMAWQGLFFGFFLIAAAGIWKAEKTAWNLYINIVAAVIGIGMNQALVPRYGAMGAASATAITYAAWIILTVIISRRFWDIGLPYILFSVQVLSTAFLGALLILLSESHYYSLILVAAFAAIVLLLFSSLSHHDWQSLLSKLIKSAKQ